MPPEGGPSRPGELPAAVLWDLDGTLIDSEPFWIAEEYALVERFGGRWSRQHAEALVGGELLFSARYIREHSPVTLTAEQIVQELLTGVGRRVCDRMPWRAGAGELLADLRAHGVPCALVTMSWRRLVDTVVARMPPGSFAATVTGDEVAAGKPDPEPYRRAAQLLGVAPEDCVALEDSATGMASAHAAGARTVVIPNAVPVPPHPGVARLSSLVGVRATDLLRVAGGDRCQSAATSA